MAGESGELMEEMRLTFPRKVAYLRFATSISKQICQQIEECREDKSFASPPSNGSATGETAKTACSPALSSPSW